MALIDHKIPIITGRNDVPTTSEAETNHPNGSYVTAKYNSLIDEVDANLAQLANDNAPATFEVTDATYYVNADTGLDSNDGLTDLTAFATIDKAIETASNTNWTGSGYGLKLTIKLVGTFTNYVFDLRNIWKPTFFGAISFEGTDINNKATFIYDNTSLIKDPFIQGNQTGLKIKNCIFNCPHGLNLYNKKMFIDNCDFITAGIGTNIENSDLKMFGCEFTSTTAGVFALLEVLNSTLAIDNARFDNTNADYSFYIQNSVIYNYYSSNYGITGNVAPVHYWDGGVTYYSDYDPLADANVLSEYENLVISNNGLIAYRYANKITLSDSYGISINNVQLIDQTRKPAIANATSGTEITTINLILDALRNHGLIEV